MAEAIVSKWNGRSQNRTLTPLLFLSFSISRSRYLARYSLSPHPPSSSRLLSVFPICYANGATEGTTSSGKCDKYLIRHNGSCRGCLIVPHVIWREVRHGLWSRSLSFSSAFIISHCHIHFLSHSLSHVLSSSCPSISSNSFWSMGRA